MSKTKPKSTFKSLPRSLKAKVADAARDTIDVLSIEGSDVAQYCVAHEQEKAAKEVKGELRPAILNLALPHIVRTNCDSTRAGDKIKSVKLCDDEGSVLRVTFKSVYAAVAKADAIAAFEALNDMRVDAKGEDAVFADLGAYATETLVASFDSKVFLNDNGDFDKNAYNKYREAIERVSQALGRECPLSAKPVVVIKDTFADSRWTDFDAEENLALSTVFTNTVDVVPLENQHGAVHLVTALTDAVDDAGLSDAEFRARARALVKDRLAVLDVPMKG